MNTVDLPTRQSFIAEMVPPDKLPNAVTLSSISVNIAWVFGAALGGVIVAFLGLATCFYLDAASFVAVLITLTMIRIAQLHPAPRVARLKGRIRAGLRCVRTEPELLVPMIMNAVIGILAYEFPVTLPLMATDTFHRGACTHRLMNAVMSVGAVLVGVVTAWSALGRGHTHLPPSGGVSHRCGSHGPDFFRWNSWCWHLLATGPSRSTPWPRPRCSWPRPRHPRPGDGPVGTGMGRNHVD